MSSGDGTLRKWKKQLITHEDPWHVHKTLGICCLISFAWRLSMMGPSDMGFQKYTSLTLPTFLLHWSLTLSSFVFNIPAKRIKSGDRIWPEYRLHALVFLSRALLCCSVIYYEQYYHLPPNYDLNFAIVILTLLAADVSSGSVQHRSGSIRDLDTHPAVKFFFSWMQFGATSAHLYGARRFSLLFYMAFIVQVNPFLMTLRRKNLLSKNEVLSLYGAMLLFAFIVAMHEYGMNAPNGFNAFLCQGLVANIATVLRLGPCIPILRYIQDNKYILWISLGLLLRNIRTYFDTEDELPYPLGTVVRIFRVLLFSLFIWKGWIRDWYNERYREAVPHNRTPNVTVNGTRSGTNHIVKKKD
jgi:hypothetical protein